MSDCSCRMYNSRVQATSALGSTREVRHEIRTEETSEEPAVLSEVILDGQNILHKEKKTTIQNMRKKISDPKKGHKNRQPSRETISRIGNAVHWHNFFVGHQFEY